MASFSLRKIDKNLRELRGHYTDDELVAVSKYGTIVTLTPGKVLFEEGQLGDEMAVIISGQAKITINGNTLKMIEAGAVVGEGAVLTGLVRSATVTASSTLVISVLNRENMIAALEQSDDFRFRIRAAMDRAA